MGITVTCSKVDAALEKLEAGRKPATLERTDDVIEAISRAKREAGNPFDADACRKTLADMREDERKRQQEYEEKPPEHVRT